MRQGLQRKAHRKAIGAFRGLGAESPVFLSAARTKKGARGTGFEILGRKIPVREGMGMENEASFTEGVRLFRNKRYEAALKEFLELETGEGEYPELSYYLGLCYTHLEKYDEALLYLEQVVASGEGLIHLYQGRMILGVIYAITRRYRLSEFEFRKLLEDGFESAKVYSALAYTLFFQKKPDESIVFLEKALELEDDNANALNSFGYILAEENTRLAAARKYCERAVEKNPRNPAYLDSLGWVYYRIGNLKDARMLLRKALEYAPRNKEILFHLRTVMEAMEK
ncbi:MAG: tetratricopeptide repeat protein [Spirochaetales bacterium]|nr:tetratricopeptide repeat protein [Spirochaetales bacterium]